MATKSTARKKSATMKRTTKSARKSTSRKSTMKGTRSTMKSTRGKTTAKRTSAKGTRGGSTTRMMPSPDAEGKMTTDVAEIRRWVEERGGYPATVMGTGRGEVGVLRIDYPGYSGEGTLERSTWNEFADKFREADLVFLYQDETKDGGPSRFSKIISRVEAQTRENAR